MPLGPPIICKINWYGSCCRIVVPQVMIDDMDLRNTEYVQLNKLNDYSFRVRKVTYGIRKRRVHKTSPFGTDRQTRPRTPSNF